VFVFTGAWQQQCLFGGTDLYHLSLFLAAIKLNAFKITKQASVPPHRSALFVEVRANVY
jgi:hypothetical protein